MQGTSSYSKQHIRVNTGIKEAYFEISLERLFADPRNACSNKLMRQLSMEE